MNEDIDSRIRNLQEQINLLASQIRLLNKKTRLLLQIINIDKSLLK